LPLFGFTPYGFWALVVCFRDFGQMVVFLPFPLWFPGFRIATEIFVTLGALGRFLAFAPYSLWPMMGAFRILRKSLLFGITHHGFWAFIVFSAILGRWLPFGLFRYGFWDFELRPRFL